MLGDLVHYTDTRISKYWVGPTWILVLVLVLNDPSTRTQVLGLVCQFLVLDWKCNCLLSKLLEKHTQYHRHCCQFPNKLQCVLNDLKGKIKFVIMQRVFHGPVSDEMMRKTMGPPSHSYVHTFVADYAPLVCQNTALVGTFYLHTINCPPKVG